MVKTTSTIGLWNIFHKKLMMNSHIQIEQPRPSWRNIPCFKNNFTLES